MKKLTPFDFCNAVSFTKSDILDEDNQQQYVPFIVNRHFSYFPDSVIAANELNCHPHLTSKMQFDFLINILRKRKRFTKWHKSETVSELDAVKKYYGYSNQKALHALSLISSADLQKIKQKVDVGGKR